MFVEMRRYVFHPGSMAKYVELLKTRGHAIVRRHLGEPLAFYTTEIGDANALVHLWRYESFEDRTTRRAAMNADPEWQHYLTEILPLITQQTTTILNPVELPD